MFVFSISQMQTSFPEAIDLHIFHRLLKILAGFIIIVHEYVHKKNVIVNQRMVLLAYFNSNKLASNPSLLAKVSN